MKIKDFLQSLTDKELNELSLDELKARYAIWCEWRKSGEQS